MIMSNENFLLLYRSEVVDRYVLVASIADYHLTFNFVEYSLAHRCTRLST